MTPFPSRLPTGYKLFARGTDLILRYGSEDVVFSWFGILPVRDPIEAFNVVMEVDERIQQDIQRRHEHTIDLVQAVNGESHMDKETFLRGWRNGSGGRMA